MSAQLFLVQFNCLTSLETGNYAFVEMYWVALGHSAVKSQEN